MEGLPEAQRGKTPVYLPEFFPGVVLKKSGRDHVQSRFHNMQTVQSILAEQRSTHLTIPKATVCKEFLIEERLPINDNSFHNMGLYLSHLTEFDEAVRELTRLFSKIHILDLVGFGVNPLASIEGVDDDIRYDNLPLYRIKQNGKAVGKIGLIDLDRFSNTPIQPEGLITIARIFPYHLHLIKQEAAKLNMFLDESGLETAAAKGRKFFQLGFTDHLTWLKQKSILKNLSSEPSEVITINPEEEEELTGLVQRELFRLNEGVHDLFTRRKWSQVPPKNFFKQDPAETIHEIAPNITKWIIRNVQLEIQTKKYNNFFKKPGIVTNQIMSILDQSKYGVKIFTKRWKSSLQQKS